MVESLHLQEIVTYPNGGKSYFYVLNDVAIIIDDGICKCENKADAFRYSLITEKQNQYMHRYERVYRFLKEDEDKIESIIFQTDGFSEIEFKLHIANREDHADASPLEFLFEKNFTNVYGMSSLKYLYKEYGIVDDEGNNYFLDYFLKKQIGGIAVEENGVSYHHPQIIGVDRYRKQLQKQNACTQWKIKLYRFSTEDCQFENRIEDDIKVYFGDNLDKYIEKQIVVQRKFELYEHQENALADMQLKREEGLKSFLVVFPTASGKSMIAEEDMLRFANNDPTFKALILVPSGQLVVDWTNKLKKNLPDYCDKIDVRTYAYMSLHYVEFPSDFYTYIVVDEAHHAVAPVLKRVIQHFTPEFLLGMTATDERLDKKKLETVFGNYEVGLSLQDAMDKGIVTQANVYRIETNINLSKVRFNGKDYVNADLEKTIRVTSRNELIVDVLKQYFSEGESAKRQGVIFCVNVKHTQDMEILLNEAGLSAKSIVGGMKNANKIMEDFKAKKIRFLCACNMISEGWDYPELGLLVMARPTLSKVLYLQQIGRGLRKTDTKQNVIIIDVVDEYGAMARPCSMHSIFQNAMYVPFGNILSREYKLGDYVEIDGLVERVERIVEVDINSFEDKYGSYLSQEQLAREYYVSTGTITNWIRKGKLIPTLTFPFGNKKIHLFSPEDVLEYREQLDIAVHNDETIKDDFLNFLEERDYSMSYKMVFLISFINNLNSIGDANLEDVLTDYINFYKERIKKGLSVDKNSCPYNENTLKDRKMIKQSMLVNPFEKFERKRFMYHSKDLGMISLNNALFEKLNTSDFEMILKQMDEDILNYYNNLNIKD